MQQKLIFQVVLLTCLGSGWSISLKEEKTKYPRNPDYDVKPIDYDYELEPKWASWNAQRAKAVTTQRPFVKYWRDLMRNVRLNMPQLAWNVTNPLANLFNRGEANMMETPVASHYQYASSTNNNRKRKNPNKQKTTKRNKKRKSSHKNHPQRDEVQPDPESPQYALHPFPNGIDPSKAIYFYDPNTDKYFQVQTSRTRNHYVKDNYYYDKNNYYDEENESQDSADNDFSDSAGEGEDDFKDDAQVANTENDSDEEDLVEETVNEDPVRPEEATSTEEEPDDGHSDDEEMILLQQHEDALRNVLGAYMSDDSFTRQRQRSKPKTPTRHTEAKTKPRKNYKYFFIQPF